MESTDWGGHPLQIWMTRHITQNMGTQVHTFLEQSTRRMNVTPVLLSSGGSQPGSI